MAERHMELQQTESIDTTTLIVKLCPINTGIRFSKRKSVPCNVSDALHQSGIHSLYDDVSNTTQSKGSSQSNGEKASSMKKEFVRDVAESSPTMASRPSCPVL